MQDRLLKAGVRPINNIVDITNYVMLEMGQPMHAFDRDKLAGRRIIVRNAAEGEKMVTLDGVERTLSNSMLVIADQERPVAIAGIMGSSNSEIDENTKTLVFESANFEPVNIRLSSKKLGLRTEASGRYEKGIDAELTNAALERACHLVQQLGAGEVVGDKIDLYSKPKQNRKIQIDPDRVRKFLGADISGDDMRKNLEALEFGVDSSFEVTVPTFRDDVEGEADIIEEITRIYGYDNIPSKLMDTTFTQGGKSDKQKLIDRAKDNLIAQGLYEVYTYSFVSPGVFNRINLKAESPLRNAIKIINPLGEEQSIMRTTLLPNMMDVIARNYNKKTEVGKFFELSKVYHTETLPLTDLAEEREVLTVGLYGGDVDFFDLKGIVENLMDELNIINYRILSSNHDSFHPGRTAELIINNKRIGLLGEVHPDVLDNYDVPVRVYAAELNFDEIANQSNPDI
jgi:phenylalanyl-tRNA synthetase beta chain